MHNLADIKVFLSSGAWQEVIKPMFTERRDGILVQLALLTRPKDVSDDFLRGHFAALDWVINLEARVNHDLESEKEDKKADMAEEPPPVGTIYASDPESTTE